MQILFHHLQLVVTSACVYTEDGIFLPEHVRVLSLLFICISYCAFGWYDK